MKKLLLKKIFSILILAIFSIISLSESKIIDEMSNKKMDEIFKILSENKDKTMEQKMEILSSLFLETSYVPNRLIGDSNQNEELVIDLLQLDCFTYLDYLETFRRANSKEEFIDLLKKVRYIDSTVEYLNRKHFFSDWIFENSKIALDLVDLEMENLKKSDVVEINHGKNGEYIQNLGIKERVINYISREDISDEDLSNLITGDYIGFRRNIDGLDVTHVGMVVLKEDGIYVRHASSSKSTYKVVDQKLIDYININTGVKGILIFRSNLSQIKVEYIDIYGNVLKEPLIIKKNFGDEYNVEILNIDNYIYKEIKGNISGIVDKNDIIIKIIYYPDFLENINFK